MIRPASSFLPCLLVGAIVMHFVLGCLLGLTADEAHYALYGAHLALSYFDHPPLVGWIQAPLVALSVSDGVLRLIPEVIWLITAGLVHACTRCLQNGPGYSTAADGAFWAVLIFATAPLLHVLGIGLLPDSLLMLWTAALLWQTLRMRDPDRVRSVRAWLVLGALLGLAGLSKYTAVFAAIPVLASLLQTHGLKMLRRPGPWLALALALGLVAPVFVWNARHDWVSFAYQLHHGGGGHWAPLPVLVFLIIQVLLYPGFLAALPGLRGAVRTSAVGTGATWPLLSFFALPMAVLAYLSGGGTSLPHWTAPAWVGLAPFAGLALARLWAQGRRLALRIGITLQVVVTLTFFTLMLSGGLPGMHGVATDSEDIEPLNPFTDFYGWPEAAERARQLASAQGIDRLAVQNWTLASRLAWYARPWPVHVLAPGFDQFSIWSGPLPKDADAVVVDWSQLPFDPPVGDGRFAHCDVSAVVPVHRAGRLISHFTLSVCRAWGGQPSPHARGDR